VPTVCDCCGVEIPELPRAYAVPTPDAWESSERDGADSHLLDELCVVQTPDGDRHFFIRGNIEIPVRGEDAPLVYTVWVSLSPANFERAVTRWQDPNRTEEPPYFGWLSNRLPGYPDTAQVKTLVRTRAVGLRPLVELEPTDHPLAVEQRDGIAAHRLLEIAGYAEVG